jgi:hypothetical protein
LSTGVGGRRFPPPWSVGEQPACFVVRDHNRQALAYVYYEDDPVLNTHNFWRMRVKENLMPRFYFNLASKDHLSNVFRAQRRATGRESSKT